MIPTNFAAVVFRECLIAKLCTLKLPGVQLAMLILIAQGRHSELKLVGNNRQSRDQAEKQLWAKGHLEMRDGLPQISRTILKEVEEYVCSIQTELLALRLPGPSLVRPPAFDWDALSNTHRRYFLAALTEAAIIQCEVSFQVAGDHVRELLSKLHVPDLKTRVIGMARLLVCARHLNENNRRLGLRRCVVGAMDLKLANIPRVNDPRTVLADWLANSPWAEEFPRLPCMAENCSVEPSRNSGTDSAAEKKTPELVGKPMIDGANADSVAGQDTADKLKTQVSDVQHECDAVKSATDADQTVPDPQEHATLPTEVSPGIHAPDLPTTLDAIDATKLISSTPIDEAAPRACPSSITTADGASRDDAASTGVDASTQPPLPS